MNRRDGSAIWRHVRVAAVAAAMTAAAVSAAAQPQAGALAVWGVDALAQQGPPSGDFKAVAAGGVSQTLAIRDDGTLYLSGTAADFIPQPTGLDGQHFTAVGMGRNHALAVRTDGSIVSWGLDIPGAPTSGSFVAVAGGGLHSVALGVDGHVAIWGSSTLGADYDAVVGVGAPVGKTFMAIAARGRYTLGLTTDGQLYGWGVSGGIFNASWTSDGAGHYLAPLPPGSRYTSIAAGLSTIVGANLIAATRQDGRVVVWDPDPNHQLPEAPADIFFTQVAISPGYVVGLDAGGHLHAWADATHAAFVTVPPGIFSAVSAANTHATAIAIPPVQVSEVGRSKLWIGLKNSDDVGTKFDLLVEMLHNGIAVTSGELDNVPGGSSGFNNAVLRQIAVTLASPVSYGPGDVLAVRLSVRIAVNATGHRSGTARLWYGDAAANSRIEIVANGVTQSLYLVPGAALSAAPGSGKTTADVFVDRATGGNPFKPFGTWNVILQ